MKSRKITFSRTKFEKNLRLDGFKEIKIILNRKHVDTALVIPFIRNGIKFYLYGFVFIGDFSKVRIKIKILKANKNSFL